MSAVLMQEPAPAAPEGPHEALRRIEARFAMAERAARMGFWHLKIGDAEPVWSPGMFALMGLDPETFEPSSEWLLDRMHPDDRPLVHDAIRRAIIERQPFFYRTRGLTPGGTLRHFDTYGDVELGADGRVAAVLGVVQEVTDSIAAREALLASEEAYRFLSDEASDIISRHSSNGAIIFCSPAVTRVLGYDQETYLGMSPWEKTHPDDHDTMLAALANARVTGQPVTYAFRAKHKAGHWVWLESTTRFLLDKETGDIVGAISSSRDISERKRTEDDLKRARERAEMASQTKSRFLANMSHELRTPLNAIIGFSDILQKELFGPLGHERYTEYSGLINESGTMLLDLINDLLDMSKIEAGKFDLHYEEIAASELGESCVRMVSRRAEEKGVSVSFALTPERFLFRADRRAFKQILLNLLSNAVKFTERGGTVSVSMALAGNAIELMVKDTGIGIPAEVLPRLGQPFEQAQNDASRTQNGSGLGLALVKSLTHLHGGQATVESTVGVGTTVTVSIPAGPELMLAAREA